MFEGARVAVVVPAYFEERLIERSLRGIPDWVDDVIVVDDASSDRTVERAEAVERSGLLVIQKQVNEGVGAAILDGYRAALSRGSDVMVVMAGDAQMDPSDLPQLVTAALDGADYVKGNRFLHPDIGSMPVLRRWGGALLSWLTARACGQPIQDSQCGFTAINRGAARCLIEAELYPGYGYPNDALITLARRGHTIGEVTVRPIYGDESSGLRFWHVATIARLIATRSLKERHRARSLTRAPVV